MRQQFAAMLGELSGALHTPTAQARIVAWRSEVANAFAGLPRLGEKDPELALARDLLHDFRDCGLVDYAMPPDLLASANAYAARGGSGLVAAMLLVPAWQWPGRPRLNDVPRWLVPMCADFLFSAPRLVTVAGQADAFAACYATALQDLATITEANRSSAVAVAGLDSFRRAEALLRLPFTLESLERIDAAHCRLLSALTRGPRDVPVPGLPREGRKLRLGIVARSLELSATTMSLLGMIERLDAARFELTLFLQQPDGSPVMQQLTNRGATVVSLADDVPAIMEVLRDAFLDVAVLVVDGPSSSTDPIAALASRRFAVVQVVHHRRPAAFALREIDLILRGELEPAPAKDDGNARTARLPGLGAIALCELQAADSPAAWTRAEEGLPDDAFVCAALVELWRITPEVQDLWVQALERIPNLRLLIAPPVKGGQVAVPELDPFCARLSTRLGAAGIDVRRVHVVPFQCAVFADWKQPLALADIVLDVDPAGDAEPILAALGAGLPVIAPAPAASSSRIAALLEHAGLTEFVARDAEAYVQILIQSAARDEAGRADVAKRCADAGGVAVGEHDSLARSEALGGLLETAFDQIVASRRQFEKERTPLTNTVADAKGLEDEVRYFIELNALADAEVRARALLRSAPASPAPRLLLATIASLAGRTDEAMLAGVSAVELRPFDAAVWHELAVIARRCWRMPDAVKALESALNLDQKRIESWRLLLEIVTEAGNASMRQDVITVLRELDPNDPSLVEPASADGWSR